MENKIAEVKMSDMTTVESEIIELKHALRETVSLSREVFAILTEGNVPIQAVEKEGEPDSNKEFPERFEKMRRDLRLTCHNTLTMEIIDNLNKIKAKIIL